MAQRRENHNPSAVAPRQPVQGNVSRSVSAEAEVSTQSVPPTALGAAQTFLLDRPYEPTCMGPDNHGWCKRIIREAIAATGKTPGFHSFNYMVQMVGVRDHGYMFNRQVGDGSAGFWKGRVMAALDYCASLVNPSAEMTAFSVLLAAEVLEVAA